MINFILITTVFMYIGGLISSVIAPEYTGLFWSIPAGFAAGTSIFLLIINYKEK